jgi:acyl-CoA synthetase (AMP-forming)/AMP-acid ligase II
MKGEKKLKEKQYLEQLHRLWGKNWPAHLPKEPHYPFGEIPLTAYLREWARRTPDKPCLIFYGNEITFKQLDDLSNRFASFLAAKGLKKGDRVAVFLPNCPQFHIAFFGILKIGCIHVPVNPMFKEHELLYELNDADAQVIVTLDQLYPIVQTIKDQTNLREVVVTSFADYLPENPTIPVHETLLVPKKNFPGTIDLMQMLAVQSPDYPDVEVGLDDVVALNYTGGTTGMPKGCEHTQRNMIYTAACAATFLYEITPDDMCLTYLPIFWIAGEDSGILSPVFSGATHILLARWDAKAMLTAIDRYKVTHTGGVVDNIVEMMEHPDVKKYDLSSIKVTTVSSFVKKINMDYRARWKELTGAIMREASWGMTETHTVDTFTNGMQDNDMDLKSQPIFVGLPMPGTEFKIVDFDTGELVPLGHEGEIVVRTPSLLKSYWRKPEATKQALRDGWLFTGDIGMIDEEGYLHFLGRRKEMLKVKGMSVFPSEIEAFLGRHPAIVGSGVIGKPEPDKGEVPVAFIKLHKDYEGKITEEELSNWCRQNMASYKVPLIKIVKELPMTATGKVKKEELKKLIK